MQTNRSNGRCLDRNSLCFLGGPILCPYREQHLGVRLAEEFNSARKKPQLQLNLQRKGLGVRLIGSVDRLQIGV